MEDQLRSEPFHLGYRPALDGLRCFAVLWVIGFHFNLPFGRAGLLGVDVFFALSGFLITALLVEEWQGSSTIQLKNFYIRRVLRLYPALLLMLIVVFAFTPFAYIASTLTYCTNWMFALHILPAGTTIDHTWSLSIEEQYYLFWPISLRFLLRRLNPKIILTVILSLAIASVVNRVISWNTWGDWWRVYAGTDMHADGLLFGSAFGFATAMGLLPSWERIKRILPLVTIIAVLLTVWMLIDKDQTQTFIPNFGNLGAALVTITFISRMIVYPSNLLIRIFSWKPLVLIGVISYGLYLWHYPVMILMDRMSLPWDPVILTILKIVLTFLIPTISYRFLEKPIQRLRTRLIPKGVSIPTG